MTTLNKQWMVDTFIQAAIATSKGEHIVVDSTWDEAQELRKMTYLSFAMPRGRSKITEVKATAQEGAFAEDLITDLELNIDDYIEQIPTELRKMSHEQHNIPSVPSTPAPDFAAAPAPAVEEQEVAPTPVLAQPQFHAETHAPVVEQAAQAVEQEQPQELHVVGANIAHEVLDTVTIDRTGEEIALEVGVAYEPPRPKAPKPKIKRAVEVYPYSKLVELKKQYPESAPSFHLKDRVLKNISSALKRASDRYEVTDGVTFRGHKTDATDPQGEGIRVFALWVHEAPARKKKAATTPATDTAENEAQ